MACNRNTLTFFFVLCQHNQAIRQQPMPEGIDTGEVWTMPATGKEILNIIREQLDLSDYRKVHWEGSFEEYLEIVRDHPRGHRAPLISASTT